MSKIIVNDTEINVSRIHDGMTRDVSLSSHE